MCLFNVLFVFGAVGEGLQEVALPIEEVRVEVVADPDVVAALDVERVFGAAPFGDFWVVGLADEAEDFLAEGGDSEVGVGAEGFGEYLFCCVAFDL